MRARAAGLFMLIGSRVRSNSILELALSPCDIMERYRDDNGLSI
jgi:hypothetical protein